MRPSPSPVLGVFLGPRQLRALVLDASTVPACCRWQMPRDDVAAADAAVDGWLRDAVRRAVGRVRTGVFVLDADGVCRDVVTLPPGLSPQDRAFQWQAEMAARFPVLGDAPVCVPAADQTVHAVSHQTLMRCDRLARALGLRQVALGSASAWDAMPPSAQEATVPGLAHDADGAVDPLMRIVWRATQDWTRGVWHGPDWGPHLPVMQARQWRVWWGRCAVSLGLGAAVMCSAVRGVTLAAEAEAAPTDLAVLAQTQAREQARLADLQALVRWQDDWQRGVQVDARVLHVPTQIAGIWLDRLQQQETRWQWQGEAVSPEAVRQLQQALTAARPWRKPPTPVFGEWRAGHVGAVAWHFRLEAEAPLP